MNKEVAKLWVEALRSGKYKQGTGRLQSNRGFCCLGVLCKIAPVEVVTMGNWIVGETLAPQIYVQAWAELKTDEGELPDHTSLAGLNDTGKSFADLADIIEQNVEAL